MPILKKNDITPERPVILVLYGTPGSGKTSAATTATNPILIDTDRGYDRAVQRVDTLEARNWQDIDSETATIKSYRTVIVDTAKAMLDDYLSTYAVEQNYKLKTNTLKRFGQMADDFKMFVNTLRRGGSDIIFICHDRETAEGDVIRHSPDCTGQSKDLLLRIADQVGYICMSNGRRTVTFEPSDNFVGKNVAGLPSIIIPDSTDPEFPAFMAGIIQKVKDAIMRKSNSQNQSLGMLSDLRDQMASAMTEEDTDHLLKASSELPDVLKGPFFAEMKEKLSVKGFLYDKSLKKFRLSSDEAADQSHTA